MEPKEPVDNNPEELGAPELGEVVDAPIEYLEDQNTLGWMKEQAMQEKVSAVLIWRMNTRPWHGDRDLKLFSKIGIIKEKWCKCYCTAGT